MHLAYLISAHTDASQLKRLVESLHPDAEFFIHIDKKVDITSFQRLLTSEHVHFIPERVDVVWGTLIEVEYQMHLLRNALAFPKKFDYLIFLSGMDYPLWSNARITQWLTIQRGREILQGFCMDCPELSNAQYEMYTLPRPLLRWRRGAILLRLFCKYMGIRKSLSFLVEGKRWKLYKGSAWWAISESLATHVVYCYDEKRAIRRYFKDSFGPAETLIQTIAFNSPTFADQGILTKGKYPGLEALTPLHFIDYDPVIKVLDEDDLSRLIESDKMFCRKIVSGRSDRLVELLQQRR